VSSEGRRCGMGVTWHQSPGGAANDVSRRARWGLLPSCSSDILINSYLDCLRLLSEHAPMGTLLFNSVFRATCLPNSAWLAVARKRPCLKIGQSERSQWPRPASTRRSVYRQIRPTQQTHALSLSLSFSLQSAQGPPKKPASSPHEYTQTQTRKH
jgi:hypothetical protein